MNPQNPKKPHPAHLTDRKLKLKLKRETLRRLDATELAQVAGGTFKRTTGRT